MQINLRESLNWVLSIAAGTAAGFLVIAPSGLSDSGLAWLPNKVLLAILKTVEPGFDNWLGSKDGTLVAATLIAGLPNILVFGLGIGIALPRIRYPRLVMYSILVYPVYYWGVNALYITLLKFGAHHSGQPWMIPAFQAWKFGLDMTIMFFKYSMLYVLILAVRTVAIRPKSALRVSMD
jgi:hypothetical protein